MSTSCDFGHDAPEAGMFTNLREHDIGEDLAAPGLRPHHDGGGCLVAGRLDPQHHHGNPDSSNDVELASIVVRGPFL